MLPLTKATASSTVGTTSASRQRRLARVVRQLQAAGYTVNSAAYETLASQILDCPYEPLALPPTGTPSRESDYAPLAGGFFDLWYPRWFQGWSHGRWADAYFRLFGTTACLVSNRVVWRGLLMKDTFPMFVDESGQVRCHFFCFGQHRVYPSLAAFLDPSEPGTTAELLPVETDDDWWRFEEYYRQVRPTVLAFYDRTLWSLGWLCSPNVDLGEDL